MKKLITLLLVLSMLMLVSCGGDSEIVPDTTDTAETTTLDETTFAPDETTEVEDTEDIGATIIDVIVEPYYLIDASEKNIVCIKTSSVKTANSVKITNAINNHIKSQLSFVYYPLEEYELTSEPELGDEIQTRIDNGEYTEYLVELEGKTTYNENDLLSVVYTGTYNYKTAAYPTNMCFSVNLNSEAERLCFKDMYNISDELYDVFAKHAQDEIDRKYGGYGLSVEDMLCTKDSFISGIEDESSVNFYITEDSVGFIYSVPHAVGDYQTVEIPLSELEEFK